MNSSKLSITISKIVLGGLFLYFLYILSQAISTVNRRHISTKDGTYINSTRTTPQIKKLAKILTKNCETKLCSTQNILDYVSNIPYKINNFQAHTPQQTIKENFGDCDDKSNLLISLLHELNIESYFVLVPHHIFVIVHLNENLHRKALYLNGKKYYILESTAKNSLVGFPLHYRLDEIDSIIEPFENKKIEINKLEWKL
ncbi:hypothetical protein MNB_SV-14-28 [hydrothermal vent metagenome]|uniref:Transglutaminase-like domain-containing protein n=1 Tax=hydrothermal vent metagenome TaxID=652676 RepID=A0A1W1BJL0_9ZZZZ